MKRSFTFTTAAVAVALAASGCSHPDRKPASAAASPATGSSRTAAPTSPGSTSASAAPSSAAPSSAAPSSAAPSSATPSDDVPGRAEIAEAAQAFNEKLAAFAFPQGGVPQCRLQQVRNETDRSLDRAKLTDKLREVVARGGKLTLVKEPDALAPEKDAEKYDTTSDKVEAEPPPPAYALRSKMKSARTRDAAQRTNTITVTIELVDAASGQTVVTAEKVFRYVQ